MAIPTTARRTYEMLENQSLWEVAERVHQLLVDRGIAYAVVGGVAVCLHGYRRNTIDLDVLIRPESASDLKSALEADGFQWASAEREFRSPSGVAIQLVLSGESEGPGQPARFPDPSDPACVTTI